MKNKTISFSPPDITEAEIKEVAEALRSGWITTGPRTKKLEQKIAEYCTTKKSVCLNSATAALELKFDVMFHGDDWKNSDMYNEIEQNFKEHNVDLIFLPHTNGVSSTEIVNKIQR